MASTFSALVARFSREIRATRAPGIVLAAVVACALASCAETDTVGSPDPSNLLLGYLQAFGGSGAPGIEERLAAELAVEQINAAGGVLGQRVELAVADTQGVPDIAAAVAGDLLATLPIVGFVGAERSSTTLAVAERVAIPAGVALITGSATSPALTELADDDLVYRTVLSDAVQGVVAARLVVDTLGATSASIVHVDDAYGSGLAGSFTAEIVRLGGSVLASEPYESLESYADFSFNDVVEAALAPDPEVIFLVGFSEDSAKVTRTIEGLVPPSERPQLIGVDGNRQAAFVTNAARDVIEGMLGTAPVPAPSDPNFVRFRDAFEARYGGAPSPPFPGLEYDATYLMAYAIEAAGTTDPREVADAIRSVSRDGTPIGVDEFARGAAELAAGRSIDYAGASGPVDLDENGDVESGFYEIWEVVGGEIRERDTIAFP